jgi:hypothetical protein
MAGQGFTGNLHFSCTVQEKLEESHTCMKINPPPKNILHFHKLCGQRFNLPKAKEWKKKGTGSTGINQQMIF